MHRRALRHTLVVLLFLTAAGAGAFAWSVDRRLAASSAAQHTASARFDTLVQSIARFDATQQLFDPAREPETEWFARVRRLLTQIQSDATGLHGSAASASAARAFDDVAARVAAAVTKAEENLRDGYDLMAADLVQDEARPGIDAMRAAVLEWRAAEANAAETLRATLFQQLWMVLGGTLGFWAIGVLLLAPRQTVAAAAAPASLSILTEPAGEAAISPTQDDALPLRRSEPDAPAYEEARPAQPGLDLVPAAELCADIARADSSEALAPLLARSASVIGASGIVVWFARNDAELVPALAHGYGPQAQELLGTLPLADENMTTRAWHTGQVLWMDGDTRSRAAIAAPMFQGPRCTGVLTVELQESGKAEALPRALTSILAAQFATALSPQPEPVVAAAAASLEATGS